MKVAPKTLARGFSSGSSHGRLARPSAIYWQKELANTVHLVGYVGNNPVAKDMGQYGIMATISLSVNDPRKQAVTWFMLDAWDDLGGSVLHHVKKGDWIHVKGQLRLDTFLNKNDLPVTFVLVDDLHFIDRDPQPEADKRLDIKKKWEDYFADHDSWWDNRTRKMSERSPDFRHKTTGDGLWVKDSRNPSWVAPKLALDSVSSFVLDMMQKAKRVLVPTFESLWWSSKDCADASAGDGTSDDPDAIVCARFQRPLAVVWSRELANSVHLVGKVSKAPALKTWGRSGWVVSLSLTVHYKERASRTRFLVNAWGDLAHVVAQHVKQGDTIHVRGELSVISYITNGVSQSQARVGMLELNFVEPAPSKTELVEKRWEGSVFSKS